MQTAKLSLGLPVALVAVAALGARSARVPRIDSHDRHTHAFRFVLNERSELREAPSGVLRSVFPPNRGPRSNVRQVFQRNSPRRVLGGRDESLADAVIRVSPEASFPSGEFPQALLGAARALALQAPTVALMAETYTLDGRARVGDTVAIGREIDETEIHAEKVSGLDGRPVGNVGAGVQVEPPITQDEIGLTLQRVELAALIRAADPRDDDPSVHREQADAIDTLEAECPLVIGHGAIWSKDRTARFVAAECFNSLPDGAYGGLRRQTELVAKVAIAAFMDGRLREDLGIEADTRGVGRSGVVLSHVEPQCQRLGRVWLQLDLYGQSHGLSIRQYLSVIQRGQLEAVRLKPEEAYVVVNSPALRNFDARRFGPAGRKRREELV